MDLALSRPPACHLSVVSNACVTMWSASIARLETSYFASVAPRCEAPNLYSGGLSAFRLLASNASSAAAIRPSREDALLVGLSAATSTVVATISWHVVVQYL
jgi:hypothetical protein